MLFIEPIDRTDQVATLDAGVGEYFGQIRKTIEQRRKFLPRPASNVVLLDK
jgi:hypothetical protein